MLKTQIKKFNVNWQKNSVYDSFWFNKLICRVFNKGKKEFVEKQICSVFIQSRKVTVFQSLLFFVAISSIETKVLLEWVVKGKKGYLVPRHFSHYESYKLAIVWFSIILLDSKVPGYGNKFFLEVLNILVKKESKALDLKKNMEQIGVENRAFSNFSWG